MKSKLITILVVLFLTNLSFGQNRGLYAKFTSQADSLYKAKEYKKSADKFKEAFDQFDGKAYPNDRYNAACSYALANDIDNSFYHLLYLAENPKIKYKNLSHITTDPNLEVLHSKKKWNRLISLIQANKNAYEKDLDKPLVAILDSIYKSDQGYRREISKIKEKYGSESKEMKAHWKLIQETDSINLIKIKKILDERGWLGSKIIGDQGNATLFLVIQHSDLETQLKYLPMMRKALELGNARASSLALLEDRVALRQGKKQIYGSQIGRDKETGKYFVSPLIEPEKVNERRAKVGLEKIENYISNWGMTWNIDKHKERTKKIESEKKE